VLAPRPFLIRSSALTVDIRQAITANKLISMGAAGADALARMLHLLNSQAAILPFARGRFGK
jgi:hypothetical protein